MEKFYDQKLQFLKQILKTFKSFKIKLNLKIKINLRDLNLRINLNLKIKLLRIKLNLLIKLNPYIMNG